MKVEYINPFITSIAKVIKDMCNLDVSIGSPRIAPTVCEGDTFLINVGITGDLRGSVSLSMPVDSAKSIATIMMCGSVVNEIDYMAKSALCELSNMIMGNASTILSHKGFKTDITPPTAMCGMDISITTKDSVAILVPVIVKEGIDVNLSISIS